jgi:hypothetical protein
MSLKELKFLDVSDNSINCNCASMKLRDALLARGIKMAKKTRCSEPISVKNATIFKPDTKTMCAFEVQDSEMQRDQPLEDVADGSGEAEEDDSALLEGDKDLTYEDKEDDRSLATETEEEATTSPPSIISEPTSSSSTTLLASTDSTSTEIASSSTSDSATKDDITFEDTEDSLRKETTTSVSLDAALKPVEIEESNKTDDSMEAATESSASPTALATSTKANDIAVSAEEGSGESDDDGSGTEGSGIIARMPAIDFNDTSGGFDEEEASESPSSSSTTTTTTTTESSGWWGFIKNLNPWSSSDPTAVPSTTEKSAEEDLKEEQFIQVSQEASTQKALDASKESAIPKNIVPNIIATSEDTSKGTTKTQAFPNSDFEDNSVDTTPSQEGKKGIGSYVVLITLLAILVILLGFAAYKGDFCRKKRKRRDVERGTELKDMQRTLLDQNNSQPKVQPINGSTMENVPLMNSANLPDEPKNNQKSYDITPAALTNGQNKTNGVAIEVNDPVKPSRKSLKQEIEAPLNGLNPPMEPIDASIRTSLYSESNEIINALDYCERPPLTPGAHRVKITMQENPDSVPKTPVLITRMKDGENLVKAP